MGMDPDLQRRFEEVDIKLPEHEEKLIASDQSLAANRLLLREGMRMLVRVEEKTNIMIDSEIRMQQAIGQLAEAQKRTEESLKRFLDRTGNGHRT